MPSTGLELTAIDAYIYSTLANDPTLVALLGVQEGVVNPPPEVNVDTIPVHEVYPYVFAQMVATADTLTADGTLVLARADYIVKGVDRAQTYNNLRPIAQRIFQLLHKSSGVTQDGNVLACLKQRTIHYPEINEAVSYRHLGGVYRFWVEGA